MYDDLIEGDPGPEHESGWGAGSAHRREPDEGPPEVHPDQTSIPDAPYQPDDIGPCFWCPEPAVWNRIDIGLPKKANQPRTYVRACHHHYVTTVMPSLKADADAKEEKRREGMWARRGL